YIVVTNSFHPQGQVTLTYSCWVEFQQLESHPGGSILNVGSAIPDAGFTPNSRSCFMHDSQVPCLDYIGEDNDVLIPAPSLTNNLWYHLVLTKYQTTVTIYVNGSLLGSGNTQPGQ